MTLENREVSPSPLWVRSWCRTLPLGHRAEGLSAPKSPRARGLSTSGRAGRRPLLLQSGGPARPSLLFFDLITPVLLSDLHSVISVCLPRSLLVCRWSGPELCYLFSITHLFYVAMSENKVVIPMLLSSPPASPLEPHEELQVHPPE